MKFTLCCQASGLANCMLDVQAFMYIFGYLVILSVAFMIIEKQGAVPRMSYDQDAVQRALCMH